MSAARSTRTLAYPVQVVGAVTPDAITIEFVAKPGGGLTTLGALRRVDPDKWERTVRRAMKSHDGRVEDAAEDLGVSTRTLYSWLRDERFADVPRAPSGVHRSK